MMRFSVDRRRLALSVRSLAILAVAVGSLSGAPWAAGSDYRLTKDFQDVAAAVDRYVTKYGAEHVLLVVDIDNTILATDRPLGSEQWFDWQDHLLATQPESKELVAADFAGLLQASGLLYELGRMHPVQPNLPAIVRGVQERGVATIVLTSRGEEFRPATERELLRNEFDFTKTPLPVRAPADGGYLPFDADAPEASGLTAEEVASWGLKAGRPVSYRHGVMMVAGQHKGAMLATLLKQSDRKIQAVVFADNRPENGGGVFAALASREIEIDVVVYQKADVEIRDFQYSDKTRVKRQWKRLNRTLEAVFD